MTGSTITEHGSVFMAPPIGRSEGKGITVMQNRTIGQFDLPAGKPDNPPQAIGEHHRMTPAQHRAIDMPHQMRELLMEHAAGPSPIRRNGNERGCDQERTRQGLMRRNLVRYVNLQNPSSLPPTHTILTEDGREVVCIVLGHYVDAILRSRAFLEKMEAKPASNAAQSSRELALAKVMATTRAE